MKTLSLLIILALSACSLKPAAVTSDSASMQRHLQHYAQTGPHRSGSAGNQQMADYLSSELSGLGFEVTRQTFEVPDHSNLDATLTIQGQQWPLLVQPPLTAQAEIEGPLHYQHYHPQLPLSAVGKKDILLLELPKARHSSYHGYAIRGLRKALKSSHAAAVILIPNNPSQEAVLLNIDPKMNMPAVFMLAPNKAREVRLAAAKRAQAKLHSQTRLQLAATENIMAVRPAEGKPKLVISTPYSGWGHSVGERGPGVVAFLELAAWATTALPDYALHFVATSAHELNKRGAQLYLEQHAPAPADTALWLHLGAAWAARDYQDIGYRLLPLDSADPFRFLMADAQLIPQLSAQFAALPGLSQAHSFSDGPAAGELADIHKHGYTAIGLFGAHRRHHASSDQTDTTDMQFIAPVVDALKDSLLRILMAH